MGCVIEESQIGKDGVSNSKLMAEKVRQSFFLTLCCPNGNFSHGKFGSLSSRKASCNSHATQPCKRVTLPHPS